MRGSVEKFRCHVELYSFLIIVMFFVADSHSKLNIMNISRALISQRDTKQTGSETGQLLCG